MAELDEYIEKTEDVQLKMMMEIVMEYGNEIPEIIKEIKWCRSYVIICSCVYCNICWNRYRNICICTGGVNNSSISCTAYRYKISNCTT